MEKGGKQHSLFVIKTMTESPMQRAMEAMASRTNNYNNYKEDKNEPG